MKSILSIFTALFLAFALSFSSCTPKTDTSAVQEETAVSVQTAADSLSQPLVRHVVLFGFKKEATPEQIAKVIAGFAGLKNDIPEILDFEWGTDISPEGLQQGLTHCFFLTFAGAKERDAYLVHPKHQEFGGSVGALVDKITVVDYQVTK